VYGLAACVVSEASIVSLHVPRSSTEWFGECTNLFERRLRVSGYYRESGFGREGGREGLSNSRAPCGSSSTASSHKALAIDQPPEQSADFAAPDRSHREALHRAASKRGRILANSMAVHGADGRLLGEAPLGNRKDIRNAVEAARKAEGWGRANAHNRAQVLYYVAENLSSVA